jgi:hypothetical protein
MTPQTFATANLEAGTVRRFPPPPCGEGRRGGGPLHVSRRQFVSLNLARRAAPLTLPSPHKGERGSYIANIGVAA